MRLWTLRGRSSSTTTTTTGIARALFSRATGGAARRAAAAPTPTPTPTTPSHHHPRAAASSSCSTIMTLNPPLPANLSGAQVLSGPPLTVLRVPVLSDNYVWILRTHAGGADGQGVVAVVDPAEAKPVQQALEAAAAAHPGWPRGRLDFILNTHHHFDHVGGNLELKKAYPGCRVVGPKADAARIPGLDVAVGDGDGGGGEDGGPSFPLAPGLDVVAIDTPGHTRGHVCLWLPGAKCLFTGDTVFALGCGRLFEGDPATMWASMRKLRDAENVKHALGAVPPDTAVFCAHEYTQSNARFAAEVAEPGNEALQQRRRQVDEQRAQGLATVPFLWRDELATNPFLRADKPGVREAAGLADDGAGATAEDVFGKVRAAKDTFR
jgi:hydroxyacylglutathione hydrolase